jgi:cell division protein FtsQ
MMSKEPTGRLQYALIVTFLLTATGFLFGRLLYLYLGDPIRFPINTIKIVANYKHITHTQLEAFLSRYRENSFFTLPVHQLYKDLKQHPWIEQVDLERLWPDGLKITIKEKQAIASWNGSILTTLGDIVVDDQALSQIQYLPHLIGPNQNTKEVLQMYEKMSNILTKNGLKIQTLIERNNQAWEATLANGITLKLGKQDPLERVSRFCKAYPQLSERQASLLNVDLRYSKGMAVKWQTKI